MHSFPDLFGKVFYVIWTGLMSIIGSVSILTTVADIQRN